MATSNTSSTSTQFFLTTSQSIIGKLLIICKEFAIDSKHKIKTLLMFNTKKKYIHIRLKIESIVQVEGE
jgi:hypothetical protein